MLIINFNNFSEAEKLYSIHHDSIENSINAVLKLQNDIAVGDIYKISTKQYPDNSISLLAFKITNFDTSNIYLDLFTITKE